MKPSFLSEMEEAFSVRQHVVLSMNTEDRFYFPEKDTGPSNLNYFLAAYFADNGYRVVQFSPSMGLRELSSGREPSAVIRELAAEEDPVVIFNRLSTLMRDSKDQWLIIVLHAETVAPSRDHSSTSVPLAEVLHTMALDDAVAMGPSRMVLVTYSALPEDLIIRSRGYRQILLGLPSEEERLAFINFLSGLSESGCDEFGVLEEGIEPEEFSRLSAGMPLAGIEALFRSAGHHKKDITREQIRETKSRDIRNLARDLLDVSEPLEGFSGVAGHKGIKDYFNNLIPYIKAGHSGVPQAFLFQGVPGCGKSHLVKALANELGWPLLELRNVRSPYVGQSEMNMEHVIHVVEQLQPAILFFDEIDQSIGQRGTGASGDSGTSERLLARIFTWMGSLHLRGKLIFIGATNRPDILDPALLDRFGVSIPFLKPGKNELCELVPLLLASFNRDLDNVDVEEIVELIYCSQPTGRSIQEILIDAGFNADRQAGEIGANIAGEHVEKAVQNHIGREDAVEMEYISLVSLSMCSLQSLLPWNNLNGMRPGTEIPDQLLQRGIVESDGKLQLDRLHEVISELKQQRYSDRMTR